MEWSAILPLIGVALGATIPLVGVALTAAAARAQASNQRFNELRAERKEVILEYLREVGEYDQFLSRCWRGSTGLDEAELDRERSRRNGQMWLMHEKLQLFASKDLRDASVKLADRLDDATFGERPEGVTVWQFVERQKNEFLEAARRDIGVDSSGVLPRGLRGSA